MQINLKFKHFYILLATLLIAGLGYYVHSIKSDVESLKNRTLPVFTSSDGKTVPSWDIVLSMYNYLAPVASK